MEEKMYSLALRKRENNNDHFWMHNNYVFQKCEINTMGGRYWFADPFVFEHNSKLFVFYEAYDLIEKKGKIAYSLLVGNKFSDPKIIIEGKCHLSFPYIFKFNGDIYIMPESSGDYDLKLYRASCFPHKWDLFKKALPDVFACDSIFMEMNSQKFLLTNEMFHNTPNGKSPSCWVKNYLYKVDGLDFCDDGIKIAEGEFGTRNAGAMLTIGEKIYRIGQDCRNGIYGKGMILSEVKKLIPYEENIVKTWDCNDFSIHINGDDKTVVGCHTYNVSEHYEIIDYATLSPLNSIIKVKRAIFFNVQLVKKSLRFIKRLF